MSEVIKKLKNQIDLVANREETWLLFPSDLDKESISELYKYVAHRANDTRVTRDIWGWSEEEGNQHYTYLDFMNKFKKLLESSE